MNTVFIVLLIFYSANLLYYNWQWRKAAQLSAQTQDEIQELTRNLPAGNGLLINVPSYYQGIYFWTWAAPFSLRQPFSDVDFYQRFRVLESPSNYCCAWNQDRMPVVMNLMEHPTETSFIYADSSNHLTKRNLTPAQIQRCLEKFVKVKESGELKDRKADDPTRQSRDWEAMWSGCVATAQ